MVHALACKKMHAPNNFMSTLTTIGGPPMDAHRLPLKIGSHYCGSPASPNTWVDILQVLSPSNPTGRNLLTIPYD